VVKTRIQLDPSTYSKGMGNAFSTIVKTEGMGALATGFGPTAVGYFVQVSALSLSLS
jgi:solute carrier family 25 phosphate transporter 3